MRRHGKKAGHPKGRGPSAFSFQARLLDLRADPVLRAAYSASLETGVEAYLAGGAVRNIVMGSAPPYDYDFALGTDGKGVKAFSEKASRALGARPFLLDKETPSCRCVVKPAGPEGKPFTVDFSPLKGKTIAEDLLLRDFTVNAMAVSVRTLFEEEGPELLDPSGGVRDSEERVIRAVYDNALADDPLRCLRAVRLSRQYSLTIDTRTRDLIRASARLLEKTSAERIRDELLIIFENRKTPAALKDLYGLDIVKTILPEASGWEDVDGYDLLSHTLKTVAEAEKLLAGISPKTFPGADSLLKDHFSRPVGGVSGEAFFKLSAFFHDIGKPQAVSRESGRLRFKGHDHKGSLVLKPVLRRLRFSNRAANELSCIVKNHHRAFMLASLKKPSFRAKANFFRRAGGATGLTLLALALADARATLGGEDVGLRKLVLEMLRFYGTYARKKPKPLLTGDEVMEVFGLKEGPIVGEVLEKISAAVDSGTVKTKKQAIDLVLSWLSARS